jgi:hypothetical protein
MVARLSKSINWLETLDMLMASYEPSPYWDYQNWFIYARYRRMSPGFGPVTRPTNESQHEPLTYDKIMSEWTRKLDDRVPTVVKGLSQGQKEQLAALIIDSIDSFEARLTDKSTKDYMRDFLKRERAWEHKLDNKAKAVLRAVEKWKREIKKKSPYPIKELSYDNSGIEIRTIPRVFRTGHSDAKIVEDILRLLKNRRAQSLPEDSKRVMTKVIDSCRVKNPAAGYMVFMYWFFRHDCKCLIGDAEERVALIRNTFWNDLAKPVKLNSDYYYEDAKGCNAVRIAVERFTIS